MIISKLEDFITHSTKPVCGFYLSTNYQFFLDDGEKKDFHSSLVSSQEIKNFVFTILSEVEKNELLSNQKNIFYKFFADYEMELQIKMDHLSHFVVDSKIYISRNINNKDWDLNYLQLYLKSIKSGIILICGPQHCGKTLLTREVVNLMDTELQQSIGYYNQIGQNLYPQAVFSKIKEKSFLNRINILDIKEFSDLDYLYDHLSKGCLNIINIHSNDWRLTLNEINQTKIKDIFFHQLKLILQPQLINSVKNNYYYHLDSVRWSRQLQEEKKHKNIYELEIDYHTDPLNKSQNQGLLSALLKRKIDMKTAFEYSDNSEELDKMLKKIGI